MRIKGVLLLLIFGSFLSLGSANSQTSPLFPMPGSFPSYQPSDGCPGCTYLPIGTLLSGDFNGDGKIDFAYLEEPNEGNSDQFLVVALSTAGGIPQQVGTELKQCTNPGLTAVDVNQDGHLDLVLTCTQGYIETLLGNGDGTFKAPVLSTLPSGVSGLAIADFNGDKLPDIAYLIVNAGNSGYAISLNLGNGQFAPSTTTYPLSLYQLSGIAAGDFNGDGKQDLVFEAGIFDSDNPSRDQSGYVPGNGDGTFGSLQLLPYGSVQFAVGDFNKDGYTDLAYSQGALGSSPPAPLELINGSSSGLSSDPIAVTGNYFAGAVLQTAQLTSTGNLDLVALTGGEPSVVLAPGSGTFSVPISYGNSVEVLADVNGDGALDLIYEPNSGSVPSFNVTYGNGDGSFQGWPMTLASGTPAVMGDFNGDGLPDAVVQTPSYGGPQVYLSMGDGRFSPAPVASTISSGDYGSIDIAADFNGDGHLDVVTLSQGWSECHSTCPGPEISQLLTYLGKGDGTLTYTGQENLGVEGVGGAVAGDFNGDGRQDLVVIDSDPATSSSGVIFLAGNGDGTFATPVPIALLGQSPSAIATADLNGDKKLDLVIADSSGTVFSYLGNGDGTFTPSSQVLATTAYSPVLADVTGDGIPDLVSLGKNSLNVFAGVGDGTFNSTPVYTASLPASYVQGPILQVGDLNGDGQLDIAVGYENIYTTQMLAVFLNIGAGNFTQDTNAYSIETNRFFALTQLNKNSASSGSKTYLDALAFGPGLVSVLNQLNPKPLSSPFLTLSLAGGNGAPITVGQTISLTANVSATAGSSSSLTGTITFSVNQQSGSTCTLTQNQCSVAIPITTAGTLSINAVYSGDASHGGAQGFITLTASPAVTSITLSANPSTVAQGVGVTFTAGLTPSTATGTVTFLDGSTTLGTGNLSAGVATFATTTLAVGQHSITASYAGDANDAPSVSAVFSVVIIAPSIQLAATPTSLSIAQGASGSTTINVTPTGAYAGTLNFTCSGLPQYATCTFSPATLTFAGSGNEAAQSTALTIATNVSTQTALNSPILPGDHTRNAGIKLCALALLPAFILIGKLRRYRKSVSWLLLLLFFGAFGLLQGCGSSSSSAPVKPITPVGSGTVTISSGSGSSLSLTISITK